MTTATTARKATRRGPVDPRLWRYSRSARRYLVLSVLLSVVITASIVVTALTVGSVLAGVITDPSRRNVGAWTWQLVLLAVSVAVRVGATWMQARFGHRAASQVVAELEGEALQASVRLPVRELDSRRAELATVLTRGINDLRPYLSGYLPALMAAVLVPSVVLVVMATKDLVSAGIVVVTLPLIPVFMILIGLLTRGKSSQTMSAMTTLSSQLLDLLAGLPTLRALGRERGPEQRVRELGEAHRRTAMRALRLAFLSSMVLELLATLCVALVAVSIGLRLVYGDMGLEAGLVALILAPEVYHPLRAVGEKFHAAEDGMAAAGKVFEVLEQPVASTSAGVAPSSFTGVLDLTGVTVAGRDQDAPHAFSGAFQPGQVSVLTGSNGAGKTTLLQTMLGLVEPTSGCVLIDGVDVATVDSQWWWGQVAWLPQRPVLVPGTLRENVELTGVPDVDRLAEACAASGFDDVLAECPDGWDTMVGSGGVGLSLGQRQRLALTRVLASPRPVLLLDEPTAHLDAVCESKVLAALAQRAVGGATVVMVAHRPDVVAIGDVVWEVRADVRN